jgi:hypothetical protein
VALCAAPFSASSRCERLAPAAAEDLIDPVDPFAKVAYGKRSTFLYAAFARDFLLLDGRVGDVASLNDRG